MMLLDLLSLATDPSLRLPLFYLLEAWCGWYLQQLLNIPVGVLLNISHLCQEFLCNTVFKLV
jgi:hypothetical protein